MKKLTILLFSLVILFASCADSKTFKVVDPITSEITTIHAEPYGWMTQGDKIPGVEYNICVGNVVWSVLLFETVVAPIVLTGIALWEPSYYVPVTKVTEK